jgi:hypothetical protein
MVYLTTGPSPNRRGENQGQEAPLYFSGEGFVVR